MNSFVLRLARWILILVKTENSFTCIYQNASFIFQEQLEKNRRDHDGANQVSKDSKTMWNTILVNCLQNTTLTVFTFSVLLLFIMQVKEANLDIIMDKMRQDSSEQV